MRVLLVDNDQDFVTLAATLLEAESEWIETVTETSPQAVFEHVDLATVDCIVSDYRMPEMDGIEFLKAVRESHPWLPFILFTQKGSEAVVEAAMDAGVSDYIVKNGSATQYAISANRIENLVRQYRTRRRANQSQALDALRRSTLQTALTEPTRAAIEAGVCEQLVASEYASVAWIGERDPHTGAIQPRVWAGDDDLRDSVSVSVPAAVSSDHEPAQSVEARALTTGRQQTESNLTADAAATKWETDAATHGFRAACAVPISYEGIPYGVLGVYSRRRTGFSADQEQLLKTVADVTGFAIAASDRRLGDTSRQVIDIEFDVSDTCLPFVDIASEFGTSLQLVQTIYRSDGTTLTRYRMSDSPLSVDEIESVVDAESVELFEQTESNPELAIVRSDSWWEELTGVYGANIVDATADAQTASLRIELPTTTSVRSVVDHITERYPGAKPIARRERTRSDRSLDEFQSLLGDRLTDRQREVIETAYHAGYYEWPHAVSSEETAELLGIAQPTFAEHFWTAHRRLVDLLVDPGDSDSDTD